MLWLLCLMGVLLALAGAIVTIYAFVAVDDLAEDLRNPVDTCKALNFTVPLHLAIQLALTLIFVWQPYLYILNLAVLFFDLWQIARRGGRLTGWEFYTPKGIQSRVNWIWYVEGFKGAFYFVSVLGYCLLIVIVSLQKK